MNWKKIKKYAKLAGLFLLNSLSVFLGSDQDREVIVDYSRKLAEGPTAVHA